jgi:hypothetical protein
MNVFVPLAAEAAEDGFPTWGYGATALVILFGLLTITLIYGSGRPHT